MNPSTSGANLPALRSHNAALVLGLLRAATLASRTDAGTLVSGAGTLASAADDAGTPAPGADTGPDTSADTSADTGAGTLAPGADAAPPAPSADDPGISRLELAERTGLTPQAVSKITARLRADGLVEEAGRRASTGGKPRTGLRLVASARYAVGVHLDGEQLTAVLTDLAGRTVADRAIPLDLGRPVEEGLTAIVREVRATAALAPGPVLGVGVGMRGPLDHATGVLHRVTGFPHWAGCPLRATLTRRLGLPVAVDKNTNAAALSVLAEGDRADRADQSFGYLHLGTGLGAALVLGGALYRGGRTGAGEFGHQAVQLDGPLCKCGNRGCLEALCLAAVERGDLPGAARLLGVGAANLVALLDIDRVVLGGRTVLADPALFHTAVAAVLAERGRAVPVGSPAAGPRAVAEGAALLALAPFFTQTAFAQPAAPDEPRAPADRPARRPGRP